QFIPFANKHHHWYERYFNKSDVIWLWPVLGGLGLGAGLMYIFDPDRGKRRRAIARDKVTDVVSRTGKAIGSKSRDLKNRAQGAIAETGSMFRGNQAAERSDLRQ